MLLAHLEHAGVAVILTAEERDADVVIVRKAIELGEQDEVVGSVSSSRTCWCGGNSHSRRKGC